jgi:uncharacterized protein
VSVRLPIITPLPPAPWYADGLKFTCTKCGNCCTGPPGYVWVSRQEAIRLAEFLKLGLEEMVNKYCRIVGNRIALLERVNARGEHDCIFLRENDGKRLCQIYAVRPLQCRTWPFWTGNLSEKEIWDIAAQRCPGMNKGRRYSAAEIEKTRDATDWPK